MSQQRPDKPGEWETYRDPVTGKLLFKFNVEQKLIEVGSRGVLHRVDVEELMKKHPKVDNGDNG